MGNDFDLIVYKFAENVKSINLYPVGDIHAGSREFDENKWGLWLDTVKRDENGYVVIVGDTVENGTKVSKTNSYDALMRPSEQKRWLANQLSPIRDKILGAVQGNHEYRSTNEVDDCPLYDVLCKLDKEDVYRPNMCFLKINLGYRNKERQFSYSTVLAHGQSKGKTDIFGYAIDGMDLFVTGHTHTPASDFPAKIVIDTKNEIVKEVTFNHIVVPSFSRIGGYSLKGMYKPQGFKIPIAVLHGDRKDVEIRWI